MLEIITCHRQGCAYFDALGGTLLRRRPSADPRAHMRQRRWDHVRVVGQEAAVHRMKLRVLGSRVDDMLLCQVIQPRLQVNL